MNKIRVVVGLAILILLGVFLGQNTAAITIQFLVFEIEVSLVILVLILLGLGFIFGYMTHRSRQRRAAQLKRAKENHQQADQ